MGVHWHKVHRADGFQPNPDAPDPRDTEFVCDYAMLLRSGRRVRVMHDRHRLGVFPRATWMASWE